MLSVHFYKPKSFVLAIKARVLFLVQRIIFYWWKNYCKKTHEVYINAYTKEKLKISCPQVYLKWKGQSISIDLYYSFNGFYKNHYEK